MHKLARISGSLREWLKLYVRITLASTLLLSSCTSVQDHPDVTWSTKSPSPDGQWIAAAQSIWGGVSVPSSYDLTTVYLNQPGKPTSKVIVFDHGYTTLPLHLKWVAPRILEVSVDHTAHPQEQFKVVFQAPTCGAVTVRLIDPPGGSAAMSPTCVAATPLVTGAKQ